MATASAGTRSDVTTQPVADRAVSTPPTGSETIVGHIWTPAGMRIVDSVEAVSGCLAEEEARVWIDVEDATEETLTSLAKILGLHKLVAMDIIERRQRAKITAWDDGIHIVLFALTYDRE